MYRKMFSAGIILLLTITISTAAQIEGLWQVHKSNDVVEIRSTRDGVKAKFVNSNDWAFYERLRNNTYEDRKGNRYYLESSNKLVWESRDGRRTVRLRKARRDYYENGYRDDQYDDYNYEGRQGRSDREYWNDGFETHNRRSTGRLDDALSGTWVNRWRNTIAYVEYDGIVVRMKTNRNRRWTTYRRTNARRPIFEDRWGNRIRFKRNGELEWRRSDGRREIEFRKRF